MMKVRWKGRKIIAFCKMWYFNCLCNFDGKLHFPKNQDQSCRIRKYSWYYLMKQTFSIWNSSDWLFGKNLQCCCCIHKKLGFWGEIGVCFGTKKWNKQKQEHHKKGSKLQCTSHSLIAFLFPRCEMILVHGQILTQKASSGHFAEWWFRFSLTQRVYQ